MREYDIVRITTFGDDEDDPILQENNIRYPEAVQYVNPHDSDIFVIDSETRRVFKFSEFFQIVNANRGTLVLDDD